MEGLRKEALLAIKALDFFGESGAFCGCFEAGETDAVKIFADKPTAYL